ncbi:gliding motility-associated C-terminal domain-containing protein, partial [Tenacibaculum bernardetii]|uniref:gliding motility-associated C-terminal domain-containing protein n=1 Tax=Tenacibaculum bernardetii TaxID=3021375 RepID=UPI0023B14F57
SGTDTDGDGIPDSEDGLDGFGDDDDGIVLGVDDTCIVVYNEITPNGDGKNDYLIIDCIENFPTNTFEVFNRWGNTVYKVKGYNNRDKVFNGISEGRLNVNADDKLPVGTYFYILDLGKGMKHKKGWIYISR